MYECDKKILLKIVCHIENLKKLIELKFLVLLGLFFLNYFKIIIVIARCSLKCQI